MHATEILLQLIHAAGSYQNAGSGRMIQNPRQSHLSQGLPSLLCHLVQCMQLSQKCIIQIFFLKEATFHQKIL